MYERSTRSVKSPARVEEAGQELWGVGGMGGCGEQSLISPGRLWSSLGNRIWKHRFSKLGELGSALERRHTDYLAPGEAGGLARPGAYPPPVFTRPLLFLQGSGLSP